MASVDGGDWSSLPPELLWQIATNIKILSDYVRFRAVCISWRSSAPATPTHLPSQPPWLMLPHGGDHGGSSYNHRAFFDIAVARYHYLRLSEPLHHHRRCRGSSHGWLVILDESPSVVILNPLTGAKLNLPPLSALPQVARFDYSNVGREYALRSPDRPPPPPHPMSLREMRDLFIRKFILSDSPCRNPGFTALAILNRNGDLACCKSGQDHWTLIPELRNIEDAVYFEAMVYAVDRKGYITICDVSSDSPDIVADMLITGLGHGGDTYYLVSACDKLLLITRFFDEIEMGAFQTREFQVYRLNSSEQRWEKVTDLGDLALFLGGNSSSSALMASGFPGCRGNSIYFTDDDGELDYSNGFPGEHDMGIFRLEDGSIQRLPCDHRVSLAHPVWITPNPF